MLKETRQVRRICVGRAFGWPAKDVRRKTSAQGRAFDSGMKSGNQGRLQLRGDIIQVHLKAGVEALPFELGLLRGLASRPRESYRFLPLAKRPVEN